MFLQTIKNITLIILCASFITSCNQSISYKRPQILANFGTFECSTHKLAGKRYSSIWEKTRSGFCLDTVYSPRVNKEIDWFMNNKEFLYRSLDRARPFLYHVILELERNNLPFELALLPIVESGYQPYAYSPSKAAGIWQFIPPTAREYGLKKNWWYDGRRDIFASTKAASHFLKDMKRHFKGDWLLAIASYNTGAGNVGKSIKKANYVLGNKTFWDLDLPRETEIYVPKLIALRDIMANPAAYGIRLPALPNKPQTKFVNIKYPIDFYSISVLSGVDEETIYKLNPGFSAWYFLPTMQKRLLLPINNADRFSERYSKLINLIYDNQIHLVTKGDTLSRISRRYNVSIKSIKILNNLKSDLIKIDQKLKLPIEGVVTDKNQISIAGKNYKIRDGVILYNHKIKRYDNWYKIAREYNTNLKTLLSWNNANKKTKLKVGQFVKIEMKIPVLSSGQKEKLRYVVGLGDTVKNIALGFDVTQRELLKDNNIKNSRSLRAGKNLIIMK
jgi:membrane-bound lytic murein transglycosylase D